MRWLMPIPVCVVALLALSAASQDKALPKDKPAVDEPVANRPKVPGKLRLHLRERKEAAKNSGSNVVARYAGWEAAETAVIICDMWDGHYCKSAAQRVGVRAPKMNQVSTAARNHGVMIIHAPSGTLDVYAETPYRKRMQQAKAT